MKKYFIVIFALAGMASTSFALTNVERKQDIFKAEIGPAIPFTGDLEDVAETGFLIGGQWIHRISSRMGFGGELSFTSYGDKSERSVETHVDTFSAMGLARYELNDLGSKEPYLLAGLGFAKTDLEVRNGHSGFDSNDEDDTKPSLLVGAGLDIPINNKMMLGFEARYQQYFFDIEGIDGGGALQLLGQLRW